jgi:hypothetical protein
MLNVYIEHKVPIRKNPQKRGKVMLTRMCTDCLLKKVKNSSMYQLSVKLISEIIKLKKQTFVSVSRI